MPDRIFANTKGQRLDHHLFAVGYLAYKILKRIVPENDNLAKAVFIAGCWHDIGKIDSAFQDWLSKKLKDNKLEEVPEDGQHIDKKSGKFSWQKHPRHNEISLLLFHILNKPNGTFTDRAEHLIFWHHAKPFRQRNDEIKKLIGVFNKLKNFEQEYPKLTASAAATIKSVKAIANDYMDELPAEIDNLMIPKYTSIEDSLESVDLPAYKRYSSKDSIEKYQGNIQHNALNNLARSALITADRLVSRKLSGDSLSERISSHTLEELLEEAFQKERGLKRHIQCCLKGFNQNNPDIERNQQQAEAAKELADEEVKMVYSKVQPDAEKRKSPWNGP